eukprot:tig00000042_g15553.t1
MYIILTLPAGVAISQSPAVGDVLYPAFAGAGNPEWTYPLPPSAPGVYEATVVVASNPTGSGPIGSCSILIEVEPAEERLCGAGRQVGDAGGSACPPAFLALPLPADGSCTAYLPDLRPNVTYNATGACPRPNPHPVLVQDPAPQPIEVGMTHRVNISAGYGAPAICSTNVAVYYASAPVLRILEPHGLLAAKAAPGAVLRRYSVNLACSFNAGLGHGVQIHHAAAAWTFDVVKQ